RKGGHGACLWFGRFKHPVATYGSLPAILRKACVNRITSDRICQTWDKYDANPFETIIMALD
ncbi:MAG: hypothetical protein IKM91_06500, partial [Candidatus Methanomethylophilaceae archaeon]|nr:hypothetical protein [Candidatus Methanomethylophilaceae archaeon]